MYVLGEIKSESLFDWVIYPMSVNATTINHQVTYMLRNTFFAPMHPAFREIDQKKPAIIRSYNILRLKITMRYSETVKVVHQLEYLKSVEGRAPICHIHRYNVMTTGLPFFRRQVFP